MTPTLSITRRASSREAKIPVVWLEDWAPDGRSVIYRTGANRDALDAGPLTIDKAIDHAIQIADALAAAHAKGIIHRDIKPENLSLHVAGAGTGPGSIGRLSHDAAG